MTTTLSSAGGTSLVTDGTGPTLQIKGLSGGTGLRIDSSSTTLSMRMATPSESRRFFDDFNYYPRLWYEENSYVQLNTDAQGIFNRENLWNFSLTEGTGGTLIVLDTTFGKNGVVQFFNDYGGNPGVHSLNNVSDWSLGVRNAGFPAGGGKITYETAIYVPRPGLTGGWSTDYLARFGLITNAGYFVGFSYESGSGFYLRADSNSVASPGTRFNTWLVLKLVLNYSTGVVDYYINGVYNQSISTTLPNTYYMPYFRSRRSAYVENYSFYIDYVDVYN